MYLYRRGKTKKGKIIKAITESKTPAGYEQEIAYWRKANAIHSWFITNCADGKDECQTILVSEEKLKELLKILIEIDNSRKTEEEEAVEKSNFGDAPFGDAPLSTAERLLPTSSGFFFGETEYDDFYFDEVHNTIEIITNVLKETDFKNEKIEYEASW